MNKLKKAIPIIMEKEGVKIYAKSYKHAADIFNTSVGTIAGAIQRQSKTCGGFTIRKKKWWDL